ncbi:MAG: lactate dehydrogenase [Lachnospiraceae bacterium]|nr:lactate dehydrogenase [Lachnospiraceae bacterium]
MKRIEDLYGEEGIVSPLPLTGCGVKLKSRNRVHLIALGDVGSTVLVGLRLLGGDVISSIGICDIAESAVLRLEMELNQIVYPFGMKELPPVEPVDVDHLYDCDLLIFCASKGVPPVGSGGDVRMAQLAANRELAVHYGRMAAKAGYSGMVAMVSDPVDPLCRAFLDASGLEPARIQGYGLGVMNARALYYARQEERFAHYETEGRAYGPHGADLVIADSVKRYDDNLSRVLTKRTVEANVKIRELGFKPYIAPALSSAALSVLLTLRGEWHYSSLYLGDGTRGAFLGIKNRLTAAGPVYEDLPLPDALYTRIRTAYHNLCELG